LKSQEIEIMDFKIWKGDHNMPTEDENVENQNKDPYPEYWRDRLSRPRSDWTKEEWAWLWSNDPERAREELARLHGNATEQLLAVLAALVIAAAIGYYVYWILG
jgi:hypothetical protein